MFRPDAGSYQRRPKLPRSEDTLPGMINSRKHPSGEVDHADVVELVDTHV